MRPTAAAVPRPAAAARKPKKGPFQGQPDRPPKTTALPTDPVPSTSKTTAPTTGHRNTVPVTRPLASEARQRSSGGKSSQAFYSESDVFTLADLIADRTRSTSVGMIRWMALYLRLQEAEGEGKTPSKEDVAALQLAARGKVKTPPIPDSQKNKITKREDAVSRDKPAAQAIAPSPALAPSRGVAREQPPSVSQHTEPASGKAIPRVHKTTDRAVAPPAHAQSTQENSRPPESIAATEKSVNKQRLPPIIVENLPEWAEHLQHLAEVLGRNPNARAYGNGIRFFPEDAEEYHTTCEYLKTQKEASWFTYSPHARQELKVAIRGLPKETDPLKIIEDLRMKGFDLDYVKQINGRNGRSGCIYHAALKRTPALIPAIYNVDMILRLPVQIEAWRGERRLAQCFRCQQFRHSSQQCFRRIACVRCGGPHFAHACDRPRDMQATCANCGGAHTANNKQICPVFRRELKNRRAGTVARLNAPRRPRTDRLSHQNTVDETAAASLMAPANDPPPRGSNKNARRTRRKRAAHCEAQPADTPAQADCSYRLDSPEFIVGRERVRTAWTRIEDQPLGYSPRQGRLPRTDSPCTIEEDEQEDEQEQEYL